MPDNLASGSFDGRDPTQAGEGSLATQHEKVQGTGYLTSLSIDGEWMSITLSEPRGWLLRASATPSNG
jgi:hypothetical protein